MGLKCLFVITVMFSVFVLDNTGQKYIYMIELTAKNDGYLMETHHLVTTDGYVLALHRLPFKRHSYRSAHNRPVVLLLHGMFSASNFFISLGPDDSIAYNLADAGFDVWMGNARGTKNSRFHNYLDPDSPYDKQAFFDFTYEEIGLIDLAEMVDFVLTTTEADGLHFIGLGAGGTAFLVLNSMNPDYNEKFFTANLLAGVGYQRHFKNAVLTSLATFTNTYYKLWKSIGIVELFPPGSADNARTGIEVPRYCTGDLIYGDVCELMGVAEIMGISLLKALVDSETAGASVKQLAHYGQNIKSRKFRRWDYGKEGNLDVYETESPPEYDLSFVTVNITLHYSDYDHLINEKDVLDMARDMPSCRVRRVSLPDFQHFDYFIDPDVKTLVTDFIVQSIRDHQVYPLRDVYHSWYGQYYGRDHYLRPWYHKYLK